MAEVLLLLFFDALSRLLFTQKFIIYILFFHFFVVMCVVFQMIFNICFLFVQLVGQRGGGGGCSFALLSLPTRHFDYFLLWHQSMFPEGNCTSTTNFLIFNWGVSFIFISIFLFVCFLLFCCLAHCWLIRVLVSRPSKSFVVICELCIKVTCCLCGWHGISARQCHWRGVRGRVHGRTKCDKYLNAKLGRAFMFIKQFSWLCMWVGGCIGVC